MGSRANAASLSRLAQGGFAAYAERRFNLDNLNAYSFAAAIPMKQAGGFGLYGAYLGFAQSNQSQLTFSYGRKVSQGVDIGASFHYHNLQQSGIYGNSTAITGSVGLLLHLSDKITAGVNYFNPVRTSWKNAEGEHLPSRVTFGLGYDASEKVLVAAEIDKEEGQAVNVNAAIQYQMLPSLFLRAGIATQTSNYFGAIGLKLAGFNIEIASSYHPTLGLSPGVLLAATIGKQKPKNP